jgi:hypothetical protein
MAHWNEVWMSNFIVKFCMYLLITHIGMWLSTHMDLSLHDGLCPWLQMRVYCSNTCYRALDKWHLHKICDSSLAHGGLHQTVIPWIPLYMPACDNMHSYKIYHFLSPWANTDLNVGVLTLLQVSFSSLVLKEHITINLV